MVEYVMLPFLFFWEVLGTAARHLNMMRWMGNLGGAGQLTTKMSMEKWSPYLVLRHELGWPPKELLHFYPLGPRFWIRMGGGSGLFTSFHKILGCDYPWGSNQCWPCYSCRPSGVPFDPSKSESGCMSRKDGSIVKRKGTYKSWVPIHIVIQLDAGIQWQCPYSRDESSITS